MQMAIELSSLPVSDELKVFNSIQELNWAWLFFSLKEKTWMQFECLNCMMLESKYWLWKKDPTVTFQILVEKVSCTIQFDKMVAVTKDTLGNLTTFKINRTEKNVRQRPNAEKRFQGSQEASGDADRLNLLNLKDLEWLAWNWRLKKQAEMFASRKQMVFENFNRFVPMLPSPKEIVLGIIQAQIDQYSMLPQTQNLIATIAFASKTWKAIFSLAKEGSAFEKPLSSATLADPSNSFVKSMIYIYSMQSFVFSEMNKASRMKDESKIKFYGAFASALGFIVHCGN